MTCGDGRERGCNCWPVRRLVNWRQRRRHRDHGGELHGQRLWQVPALQPPRHELERTRELPETELPVAIDIGKLPDTRKIGKRQLGFFQHLSSFVCAEKPRIPFAHALENSAILILVLHADCPRRGAARRLR